MYDSFSTPLTGPRVAVFITAAYGVSELPPIVQATSEVSEPLPVQSSRASGPADALVYATMYTPWPCNVVSGPCDQVAVQRAIFKIVDPFTSNGTPEVKLQEGGQYIWAPPLTFQTVATNSTNSRLAWLRDQELFEPSPEPYLFQADTSPGGALVCLVYSRSAGCDVASAPIANATVRVSAPNPRRIIDPAATGPLRASLDVPASILSQLQVPTLAVTVQGAQPGQAYFTQGDVVTITARFDYGPRGRKEDVYIAFISDVDGALTGDGCAIGDWNSRPTDTNGVATITCTLSEAGTVEVTAKNMIYADPLLTAAANITGEGCPAAHACMLPAFTVYVCANITGMS